MTPVHVIVSDRSSDEQHYGASFAGAIELYRCNSNLEVFERLTAARTAVHVLVVTPQQDSLFNLTPGQLVERLLGGPLGQSPELARLQVVIVGAAQQPTHPRVHVVSTLDAAIRLVKFGEVESAPRPATAVAAPAVAPAAAPVVAQSSFFDSVVSSIWDYADRTAAELQVQTQARAQQRARVAPQPQQPVQRVQMPRGRGRVRAGGPAPDTMLFATPAVSASATPPAGAQPAPAAHAAPDTGLAPVRDYVLPSRGEYRGAPARAVASGHAVDARMSAPVPAHEQIMGGGPAQTHVPFASPQPVPPQLTQQVHQLVYAPAPVDDPVLGWSAAVQQRLAQHPISQPVAAPTHGAHATTQAAAPPTQSRVLSHNGAPVAQAALPTVPMLAPAAPASPAVAAAPQVASFAPAPSHVRPQTPSRLGRTLGRMRERVREAERVPLAPNVHQLPASFAPQVTHHAPAHHHQSAPIHAATAPVAAPVFDASQQLMQRAASSGDVSFG